MKVDESMVYDNTTIYTISVDVALRNSELNLKYNYWIDR